MMDVLRTFASNRLLSVALLGTTYVASDEYEKRINHDVVRAHVSWVQDECYMEKRDGGATAKAGPYSCDVVEAAIRNRPQWQGASVKYKIEVGYDYLSPADHHTHSAKRALSAWPDGKRIVRGDTFEIRASKIDPEATREM